MKKIFLFFLLFIPVSLFAPNALVIMGPSCAGKSTTVRNVCRRLDKSWQLVSLDRILIVRNAQTKTKQITHDMDNELGYLVDALDIPLARGKHVIIDTNMYDESLRKKLEDADYRIMWVLVYAPLSVLIARDEKRNVSLKREEKRLRGARAYVLSSFARFYGLKDENRTGMSVGVVKKGEVDKENVATLWDDTEDEIVDFYDRLLTMKEPQLELVPCVPCDLCLYTDTMKILECVNAVVNLIKKGA